MKVLGITLEANKIIFCSVEKNTSGYLTEREILVKKMELKDHLDSGEIRTIAKKLHQFFETENFDKIGIITRGTKGRFAASPISFKLEGLIQTYPKTDILFVAPATLRAYFKKNENPVEPKFGYQKDACEVAVYLMGN